MERAQFAPFLKVDRQKTDDSLIAERNKTNDSLTKSKSRVERNADDKVQIERLQADQATSESRNAADLEKQTGKIQLSDERNRSDKALELERSQVDQAVEKERELKSALASQLLEQERNLTDKNLLSERNKTDSEVKRASNLLSDEISEHTKTKISLTTRDEFLAIVSHDLRNPIGTASLCAEMLLDDPAFQELGTQARSSVELIKRNIDSSLRLIEDLIDIERIESGKLNLKIEKHNIGQIVKEAVDIFEQTAQTKAVLLIFNPPKLLNAVFCDKDRIMQVLSNLIGNALKFTPKGGSVTLCAELNKTETLVSVSDSGPGVPDEKRNQIFERYAQLRKNDRVGLGLGLYISKMIVESHQGRIWVNSKLGYGSVFNFTIPQQPN